MITHDKGCCGDSSTSTRVSNIFDGLTTLIGDSAQLGIDLLRSFTESVSAFPTMPSLPKAMHGCSCEIPPACWLPVEAGRAQSAACPGATATLRIRVANCGMTARAVTIEASGSPSGLSIAPETLDVGAMEAETSLLTFAVPSNAHEHAEYHFMIWVRGCKRHYVRWTVVAGEGDCRCHTIAIEDCPETVHHWYDHFYCDKPCQH